DLFMQVEAFNRGPADATLHLLPQLWFRNTWSWWPNAPRPELSAAGEGLLVARHPQLGTYHLYADGSPALLFCDNDTNTPRLFGARDTKGYFKDAFHDYLVHGDHSAVNPHQKGTKSAVVYTQTVPAGGSVRLRLRLTQTPTAAPFATCDQTLARRRQEADE